MCVNGFPIFKIDIFQMNESKKEAELNETELYMKNELLQKEIKKLTSVSFVLYIFIVIVIYQQCFKNLTD